MEAGACPSCQKNKVPLIEKIVYKVLMRAVAVDSSLFGLTQGRVNRDGDVVIAPTPGK